MMKPKRVEFDMISPTFSRFLADWNIADGNIHSMCEALSCELLEASNEPCTTRDQLTRFAVIAGCIGHRADAIQSRDCS